MTTIVSKRVLKIDDQEDNEKVDLKQRKLKKKR
jgi:hypothetical protein